MKSKLVSISGTFGKKSTVKKLKFFGIFLACIILIGMLLLNSSYAASNQLDGSDKAGTNQVNRLSQIKLQ